MERLFAVYKVENGDRILLGGLAENPEAKRDQPSEPSLLAAARKKFADALGAGSMVVLEEET